MYRANTSVLWLYFDKINKVERKAKCKLCSELYSYKTCNWNLKSHLKHKHHDAYRKVIEAIANGKRKYVVRKQGSELGRGVARVHKKAYEELCKDEDANGPVEPAIVLLKDTSGQTYITEGGNTSLTKKVDRQIDGVLLRWYELKNSRIRCRVCTCFLSQPARADNLRAHLKSRHPSDYEKLQQLERAVTEQSNPLDMEIVTEAETAEDDSKTDLVIGAEGGGIAVPLLADNSRASSLSSWDYFDNIALETATCRLCQETVSWGTSVSELRGHLLQDHSEVAASLHDADESNEQPKFLNDSNQLEEEYLDETLEDAEVEKMIKKMHSGERIEKKKDSGKKGSEEYSRKSLEEKFTISDDEWGQSLDRFGLYVSTLLRMLPRRRALNFQLQIIDRLVRETMKSDI